MFANHAGRCQMAMTTLATSLHLGNRWPSTQKTPSAEVVMRKCLYAKSSTHDSTKLSPCDCSRTRNVPVKRRSMSRII